jgi:hypothetical protein
MIANKKNTCAAIRVRLGFDLGFESCVVHAMIETDDPSAFLENSCIQ